MEIKNQVIGKSFGLNKTDIENKLQMLGIPQGIHILIEEKYLDAKIEIDNLSVDDVVFQQTVADVFECFRNNIYADENVSLAQRAMEYLELNSKTVGCAESVTGGMISSKLIGVSGASRHFFEGIVAYDIRSKVRRLYVSLATLDEFGAVSSETVAEMAAGILKNKDIDIAVASTGYADSSSDASQSGLTFVAIADRNKAQIYKQSFVGERDYVRECCANTALFYLIRKLRNNDYSAYTIS